MRGMQRLMSFSLAVFVGLAVLVPSTPSWSAGTLKVTSPNGGESWTTGKKHVIKWAKGNGGTQVKIQLFKSNKHYKWISKKTKNDGKHVWKVWASVVTGSAYKIKITSVSKKTVSDASNKNFTITKSGGKPGGPTKLGPPIPYYAGNKRLTGQRHLYAADLNGDGIDEVIYSGHIRYGDKFRVAVVDNKGKNVTTKHIRPNKISAEITQIYDLNNDGKDDVIFWGGTDSDYHMPSYVYLSKKKGPHTRKMVTPKVWYHGAGQGDLDGDGKVDFVGTGYGGKGKYVVSYKNNALLIRRLSYSGTKCCFDGLGVKAQNGSDIAIGNFDADANIELIITDHLKDQDSMAVEVYKTDNNYIYVRDDIGIKLPTEYWETPTGKAKIRGLYKDINSIFDLSHDVRLVPFDINKDGNMDLIRVSRPWQVDGKSHPILDSYYWPHYGHLQMLISQGNGQFLDQTSKYLKRWNIKLNAPYDFKFVDINKDGLTDIFYTYEDSWTKGEGTENATAANGFLINTGKGFKNYGNAWFKNLTKKAMNAAKSKFEASPENWASVSYALGNFDSDSDLEVASCAQGGNYVGSTIKLYCAFWFSDITIKFPKYKAKKTSQLNTKSESGGFHVIKEKSGKQIYTDQPWKYLD